MKFLRVLLFSCALIQGSAYATGIENSTKRISYQNQIRPILESRCTVCHGCYDAPCQLKLSSYVGMQRGLSNELTYQGARPIATEPQRLFIDAHSEYQWRERGFMPVLNSVNEQGEQIPDSSLLYKTLLQKRLHPLPKRTLLGQDFDVSLNREQTCPSDTEYSEMVEQQPLAGMPYGLPGITDDEFVTLSRWLNSGAKTENTQDIASDLQAQVDTWESFFNQQDKKSQLMSRYIYEHWFLAHIYFPSVGRVNGQQPQFFKLVRSATPPGEPIQIIATRRPYEYPGDKPVYYRLWADPVSVLLKTHLPLALGESKMARLKTQFLNEDYQVTFLPSYKAKTASNPFKAFKQIPVKSRYQFMLDEAQLTIMGFIKGPVCRGQTALSVVNDRFWVFFVDPKFYEGSVLNDFLAKEVDNLKLPAENESNALTVTNWIKFALAQSNYLKGKQELIEREFRSTPSDLNLIWRGDGSNDNATLTIFRHFDSATVERGLIGQIPKTAWLIDYALLERIHYLLVAGFDVYGNVGHQFNTRAYMDYLRMEGESNFLALLPKNKRKSVRDYWYRKTGAATRAFMKSQQYLPKKETAVEFSSDNEYEELLGKVRQLLTPVLSQRFSFDESRDVLALQRVNDTHAKAANFMPEVSVVLVTSESGNTTAYSILRNSAHYHILSIINEENRRAYDEDNLTIVPGFIGDYPGALWRIEEKEVNAFVDALNAVSSEVIYQQLRQKFGIRRTDPSFWSFSDELHRVSKQYKGIEYGLFDYNRLQDR